jgi:hypothetical protein
LTFIPLFHCGGICPHWKLTCPNEIKVSQIYRRSYLAGIDNPVEKIVEMEKVVVVVVGPVVVVVVAVGMLKS